MGTKQLKAVCLCDSDMEEIWNKDILFSFPRALRHSTQKAPHWLCGGHDTMRGCRTIDLHHNRPKAAVAVFIWKASQAVGKLWNQNVTWVPWGENGSVDLARASWPKNQGCMMLCENILPLCYKRGEWGVCLTFFEQRNGLSRFCKLYYRWNRCCPVLAPSTWWLSNEM